MEGIKRMIIPELKDIKRVVENKGRHFNEILALGFLMACVLFIIYCYQEGNEIMCICYLIYLISAFIYQVVNKFSILTIEDQILKNMILFPNTPWHDV
jgi:hypothetical protein